MTAVADPPRDASARTLADYAARAESFWQGTRDHDVSQNIAALLDAIEGEPPFTILDFGCGPGRDLRAFTARGHRAIGLDGCARFAAMARAFSGCEVWQQDFLALDLPAARFDGIFANASLFHVPRRELPHVLCELHAALVPRGVLLASNPRGGGQEGWQGDRYGVWQDLDAGAPISAMPASSSSPTTIGRPGCRGNSSRGSPPCGGKSRMPPGREPAQGGCVVPRRF